MANMADPSPKASTSPAPRAGVRSYVLRFISGKYQGGEFPIAADKQILVGRSSDLDMVLVGLEKDVRKTTWADTLRKERRRHRREILKTLKKHVPERTLATPPLGGAP
jgi:hypothetical protein